MRPGPPDSEDCVEAGLRAELARGDGVNAGVAPVLRHLLVHDDREFFADDVLAALRGMIRDAARQLSPDEEGDDSATDELAAALADVPGLVPLAHALALETHVTRRLQEVQGLDPVLSPLLQALIASPDDETAALAMQVLAAQARFVQQQRRMEWPLKEWPAEVLHDALCALEDGAEREADLRADYDEGATRLGLLSRLIAAMGAGVLAALDLSHAGVAIFASALADASGQDRGPALLSLLSRHKARLVLGLRAGGLPISGIEAVLMALHPGAPLPEGLGRITPERAAALLTPTGGEG